MYYPEDPDPQEDESLDHLADSDRQALLRIFQILFQVVKLLAPNFQIILTEHAYLTNDKEYKEAVVERWRDGNALIPREWIDQDARNT